MLLFNNNKLNRFSSYVDTFKLYKRISEQYNDQAILNYVNKLIPKEVSKETDNGQSLKPLLHWFKTDFMKWMPKQLQCAVCEAEINNNSNSNRIAMTVRVREGDSKILRRSEIHSCHQCGSQVYFPRYIQIVNIADTRIGRCSEWSILFGAILNSLSIQTRIVHDFLDHCWNESLIDNKWTHIDSTLDYPICYDHPYYYEQNWGKKYEYILGFSASTLHDITRCYTEHWDTVQKRRGKMKDKVQEFKTIYLEI
jgi:Transglutaminase-like superfamily